MFLPVFCKMWRWLDYAILGFTESEWIIESSYSPEKILQDHLQDQKKPPMILCCFFSSKVSTKGPRNLTGFGRFEGGGRWDDCDGCQTQLHQLFLFEPWWWIPFWPALETRDGSDPFSVPWRGKASIFLEGEKVKTGTRCDYIIKNEWHSSLETKKAAGPLKISTSKMVFLNENLVNVYFFVVFVAFPGIFFVQEVFGNSTQITKNMTQELDGLSKPFDLPKTREVSKFPRNFHYNELWPPRIVIDGME